MTINNRAIYTHKFIVVYAFEENSAVVLPGFAFHYSITTFWAWNQGIPLGPSGYRETTPVGMNDELDEATPIAWRVRRGPGEEHPDGQEQRPQIQRRGERGPARGGAGGLA